MKTQLTPEEKIRSHVIKNDNTGCLVWSGKSFNQQGYGIVRHNGRNTSAHRLAWILANGPIPEGLHVCHRCDNPPCCNPEHLFIGTRKDNMQDCLAKGRFATGDRSGARLHPEKLPRGDDNFARKHPELIKWKPNHAWRLNPEKMKRGERVPSHKIKERQIPEIRGLASSGISLKSISVKFAVSYECILRIVRRKTWKHVP